MRTDTILDVPLLKNLPWLPVAPRRTSKLLTLALRASTIPRPTQPAPLIPVHTSCVSATVFCHQALCLDCSPPSVCRNLCMILMDWIRSLGTTGTWGQIILSLGLWGAVLTTVGCSSSIPGPSPLHAIAVPQPQV